MDDLVEIIGYFDTNIYLLENSNCFDVPVSQIMLSFNRKLENSDEFVEYIPQFNEFSPDTFIHSILKKYILNNWDNKTIAMYGANVSKATLPVVYVDFIPTFENISMFIFKTLEPIYKTYNLILSEVYILNKETNFKIII